MSLKGYKYCRNTEDNILSTLVIMFSLGVTEKYE